jgi:hypothetical protein
MPPEPRRWQTAVADAMACEAEATVASHVPRPSVPHSAQLGVGWERSRDNGLTLLRDLEALAAELELELEPELGPELEPEPEPEPNGPRGVAVAILDAPEFAVQLSAPSSNVQRTSRSAGMWPEPEHEHEHELEPEPEPAHLLQRQPQPQPESTDVPHRLACKTDVDAALTTVVSLRGGLYYEYRLHVDRATANIIIG